MVKNQIKLNYKIDITKFNGKLTEFDKLAGNLFADRGGNSWTI